MKVISYHIWYFSSSPRYCVLEAKKKTPTCHNPYFFQPHNKSWWCKYWLSEYFLLIRSDILGIIYVLSKNYTNLFGLFGFDQELDWIFKVSPKLSEITFWIIIPKYYTDVCRCCHVIYKAPFLSYEKYFLRSWALIIILTPWSSQILKIFTILPALTHVNGSIPTCVDSAGFIPYILYFNMCIFSADSYNIKGKKYWDIFVGIYMW